MAEEGSLVEHFEGKIRNRFFDDPRSNRHIRCMFYHSNNQLFVHRKAIKNIEKTIDLFKNLNWKDKSYVSKFKCDFKIYIPNRSIKKVFVVASPIFTGIITCHPPLFASEGLSDTILI